MQLILLGKMDVIQNNLKMESSYSLKINRLVTIFISQLKYYYYY